MVKPDHSGATFGGISPQADSSVVLHSSDSRLEQLAKYEIAKFEAGADGKGLQVHLIEERVGSGELIFYTSALMDYFDQAGGDNAQSRNVFRRVLEKPVGSTRHTRMYGILNEFSESSPITHTRGNVARKINDVVIGYLLGSNEMKLYAANVPSLVPNDATPFIQVKLKI